MTTENLNQDGIDALDAALYDVDNDLLSRARAVQQAAVELDAEEQRTSAVARERQARLARADRLFRQQYIDQIDALNERRAPVNEEAGQLAGIINEPAFAPPQAPPAPERSAPEAPAAQPEPEADIVPGMEDTQVLPPHRPSYINPRQWRCWWIWLAAVIGGLIGLAVWDSTWHRLFQGLPRLAQVIFLVLWFIALVGFGFMLFGAISSYICARWRRRRQH